MPRVAHVISTPAGFGGAEGVVAAVTAGAAARGWDQRVLNPFAEDPEESQLAKACGREIYKGRACRSVREIPATRAWLRRELLTSNPDLVHAHLFHASTLTATLPRGRARMIATHHHGDVYSLHGRRVRLGLDRLGGRRFERVVAVSEAVRAYLIEQYRYPATRVVCIRNGWTGQPLPRARSVHPTVVCVANFRPEKGHAVLVSAFRMVCAAIPDAELVLIGDGPLLDRVRSQVAAQGLLSRVRFLGQVESVWSHLSKADVFALASLREPLGLAVMEAMAAGLAVIASEIGGLPELVRPGLTGELVPPNDERALAASLIRLLRDEGLRERMGSAARRVADGLRAEAMVQRYFELYEEILALQRARQ
jgi:glycosyltransferase involved in cell wall biosynthesis